MTRTVTHSNITTPASRARLKPRAKPYWQEIDSGVHLGYRKGAVSGRWALRRYLGGNKYTIETFAIADDHRAADGVEVMNFAQSKRHALERASVPAPGPTTVGDAMDAYFERLEGKGRPVVDPRRRIKLHVLPTLGSVPVDSLTRAMLDEWLATVAKGRDGKGPTRARRATANRVWVIFRAALNQSFRDGNCASDRAWRACSPFKATDAPRERFFSMDEVTRLINASQGDFRLLVKAALLSGCRYGELMRLRVGDFDQDGGFVHVQESKSGRPRDIYLTGEGVGFFTSITVGRAGSDLMLTNSGKPWVQTAQRKPMLDAMKAARIDGGSFHTLRHCAASHWLMSGVSLTTIARNLGHADSRITEKVYSHLSGNHRRDEMQKAGLVFGVTEPSTIVPLTLAK